MRSYRLWSSLNVAIAFMSGVFGVVLADPVFGEDFIVRNGQPQAEIVISERPARMAKLAAEELQTYIEKISGARLAMTPDPGKKLPVKIYVGKSAHTERLGIDTAGLAHGAYRMASGLDWLALVGPDTEFEPVEPYAHSRTGGSGGVSERLRINREWDKITGEKYTNPFNYVYPYWSEELHVWEFDDAGTLNAVYDFLRAQGVRWYYPGELGEICPKAENIALPEVDKVVRPDFPLRKPGFWSKRLSMTPEEDLWTLRMGINQGADIIGLTQICHGSKFVHGRDEFKKAHPEYFALWGGKRAIDHKGTQGAPCLSSKGFFLHHLKYARAVFDHFDEPLISIDVVDGYGRGVCQCPLCEGKGTPERGWSGLMSDYVLGYVNRVAKELYKSHPDKMVSALSYGAYSQTPTNVDTFPPNLALWICQSRKNFYNRQTRKRFLKLREDWLKKIPSKKLFIYEYYMTARPGGAWEGIPTYFPRLISEDLRSLKGVASGEYIDFYQPHDRSKLPYDYLAVNHLNLYVTTRLWWDADQDVDALLEEYYTLFYGPARDEMKAFIEFSEANWPKMTTQVKPIDQALELLTAARKAAGDTIYGKRIDLIVDYVKPLNQLRKRLAKGRENTPSARALRRSKADIKIDGKLDDKFWEKVRMYRLKETQTGTPPNNATSFRIAWGSDDALYVGIRCEDDDTKNLNIGTRKDGDTNIWNGDCVEVLLETQTHSYYQLAISPSGALMDLDRKNGRLNTLWSSQAEVATHVGDDSWSVEVRIPVAAENQEQIDPLNGVAGRRPSQTYPWYFNVCRQRVRDNGTDLSAFSPTGKKHFHDPMKFGKLYVR